MTFAIYLFSFKKDISGNDSLKIVLADEVSVTTNQDGETVVLAVFLLDLVV